MVKHNRSRTRFPTTSQLQTMLSARAAVRSMQVLVAVLLVAVVVKRAVPDVSVKPTVSARVGLVEQVVMAECNGCKKDREAKKQGSRQLTRLPAEITQDKSFQRKGLPVQLCAHCDGDALEEAIKAHKKRVEK